MELIETRIEKVDKIFHIADVHIRNYKRHKEYRQVFRALNKEIKERKTKNSIIYVAGDLVHSKNEMSPELVSLLAEFLQKLAKLCPTFVILGNHDLNLNNRNRLDAISPVLTLIESDQLYFLDKNEYYKFANLGFSVFEVGTEPEDFLPADGLDAEIKIALHHGAVNMAATDTGVKLKNKEVTLESFSGFDLALLGDIHKRQFLDKEEKIAYPGSLIQQNHGEAPIHGFLEWNMETLNSEFIPVENNFGYRTLHIDKGELVGWDDDFPKYPRLRLKVSNTPTDKLNKIVKELKKKRKIAELSIQKMFSMEDRQMTQNLNKSVRDVEYQNDLIGEYLQSAFNVDDDLLDLIRYINRVNNSKLDEALANRNKIWVPKYFKFDNMFSYGERNYWSFDGLEGVYGIFAPNATGKSTLLDALCFCIFDKCSRTNKASDILNIRKEEFYCEFCFELDGQEYFIKKRGHKGYAAKALADKVKVDIEFYTIDENGDKISLNGDKRDTTNKNIRNYIGTYEDFILTALSIQNNNTNFIDKSQRERKELLVQFLDISVFEELYQIAAEENKETSIAIKQLENQGFEEKIEKLQKLVDQEKENLKKLEKESEPIKDKIQEVQRKWICMVADLHKLDDDIKSLPSVEEIADEITEVLDTLQSDTKYVKEKEKEIALLKEQRTVLQKLTPDELKIKIDEFIVEEENRKNKMNSDSSKKQRYELAIARCQQNIKFFEDQKFNPDCNFCVERVEEWAERAKESLEEIEEVKKELVDVATDLTKYWSWSALEGSKMRRAREEYYNNISKLNDINEAIYQAQIDHRSYEERKIWAEKELKRLNNALDLRKTYDSQLQENEKNQKIIDELDREQKYQESILKTHNESITAVQGSLASKETLIREYTRNLNRLEELYDQFQAYEYYLKAIKRDGVPYLIIERTIPQIEQEINNILDQVVDFNILLTTDGKNINGHIVYDEDRYWPLELSSGMERFISSLAIRVALINVTTLPKPNFIAIDEGFGVLDSDNLNNIFMLFEYLKTQFQFLVCISHIDTMRDVVERSIEINKIDNFSKIHYE